MFIVNGHYYIELTSNGKALPFSPGTFDYLYVIQNVIQMVPTLTIQLKDASFILGRDNPLVDGAPLQLKIGTKKETEPPVEMKFRIIGTPKDGAHGTGSAPLIKAILDCPKLFSITDGVYDGPSTDVIKKIGGECGLKVEADGANDKMKWLPLRQQKGKFAHNVCNHAWADDKSIYALAVTDTHKMRFKNLATLKKDKPTTLLHYAQNAPASERLANNIMLSQYEFATIAGYNNLSFNYGSRAVQPRQDGTNEEYSTLDIDKSAGFLEMNKSVKDEVKLSASRYIPPDMGNTHKYYSKAKYQNDRGRATYGTRLDILTPNPTALELLELARFYTVRSDGSANDMYNGDYVVTAKTRVIRNNIYSEKLSLHTQGRNLDPNGELL